MNALVMFFDNPRVKLWTRPRLWLLLLRHGDQEDKSTTTLPIVVILGADFYFTAEEDILCKLVCLVQEKALVSAFKIRNTDRFHRSGHLHYNRVNLAELHIGRG